MFTLDFFNWDMFDTWEFDLRRCEGYLGDVGNLSCEYGGAHYDDSDKDNEDDDDNVDNNCGSPDDQLLTSISSLLIRARAFEPAKA
jgi:hypothetical protein